MDMKGRRITRSQRTKKRKWEAKERDIREGLANVELIKAESPKVEFT
jgi:hypothetical protein